MADGFKFHASGLDAPAENAAAITPNDTTDLPDTTRAIYVGGAGNLAVIMAGGGATITLTGVLAGMIYPLRVARVLATGTTATGLIGLR